MSVRILDVHNVNSKPYTKEPWYTVGAAFPTGEQALGWSSVAQG